MDNIYIISGGPGSGKTSLLNALRNKGFLCFDEFARQVIEANLKSGSTALPWLDIQAFTNIVLDKQIERYNITPASLCFFDRGIPDSIGYLTAENQPVSERLAQAAKQYRYNKTVFFLDPWPEIYATDTARREPFAYGVKVSDHLKNIYTALSYEICKVPQVAVDKRVEFVLKHIPVQPSET